MKKQTPILSKGERNTTLGETLNSEEGAGDSIGYHNQGVLGVWDNGNLHLLLNMKMRGFINVNFLLLQT